MLTVFQNYRNTTPQVIECNFVDAIKAFCLVRKPTEKKEYQKVWSPTIFDGKRNKDNARYIHFLVFDMDDGIDKATDVQKRLKELDYSYAIHSSSGSKIGYDKYRIIIPLSKPIECDLWKYTTDQKNEFYKSVGNGEPDQKALKDKARIYSLCYRSENTFVYHNIGKCFEFDMKPIQDAHRKDLEEDEIRKAKNWFDNHLLKLGIAKHANINILGLKRYYSTMDSDARKCVAERLKGKFSTVQLHSDRVSNFPCPHCGQSDATFFYYDGGFARCTHENSCIGWYEPVYNLAKHYGCL